MTACFTGHRPNKLGGYNWKSNKNIRIMKAISKVTKELIEEDVGTFIFGGALGVDQMAFSIVSYLKTKKYPNLKLILAIPFERQPIAWVKGDSVKRYYDQINFADLVVQVDTLDKYAFDKVPIGDYHPVKMQLRNRYMVDNSDVVVGIWDGSSGGTCNCIKYAMKSDKQIRLINLKKL